MLFSKQQENTFTAMMRIEKAKELERLTDVSGDAVMEIAGKPVQNLTMVEPEAACEIESMLPAAAASNSEGDLPATGALESAAQVISENLSYYQDDIPATVAREVANSVRSTSSSGCQHNLPATGAFESAVQASSGNSSYNQDDFPATGTLYSASRASSASSSYYQDDIPAVGQLRPVISSFYQESVSVIAALEEAGQVRSAYFGYHQDDTPDTGASLIGTSAYLCHFLLEFCWKIKETFYPFDYLYETTSNGRFVVKIYRPLTIADRANGFSFERERRILRLVSDSLVSSLFDKLFESKEGLLRAKLLYLESNLFGSLHFLSQKVVITGPLLARLLFDIVVATSFLHSHNIVVGSLTPYSMGVDKSGFTKICELGLSYDIGSDTRPFPHRRGKRGDIYDMGCTVIELIEGCHPSLPLLENIVSALEGNQDPGLNGSIASDGSWITLLQTRFRTKEDANITHILSHPVFSTALTRAQVCEIISSLI